MDQRNVTQRRRQNKRQQALLVESLQANLDVARGNAAESISVAFWAALAERLNAMGCRRTVEEWQNIWKKWAEKVRSKYRRIRLHREETGGGPSTEESLNALEMKIIDVIGRASVDGHSDIEVGLPASSQSPPPPVDIVLPQEGDDPIVSASSPTATPATPAESATSAARASTAPTTRAGPSRPRRRRMTRPRQPVAEMIEALNEHSRLMRQTILDAATIMADAIRSSGNTTGPSCDCHTQGNITEQQPQQ